MLNPSTCSLAVGGSPPTYTLLACRVAYIFDTSNKGKIRDNNAERKQRKPRNTEKAFLPVVS